MAVVSSAHASVLRQSLSVFGPSVLRKDERLSVRLVLSDDGQIWDVLIVGKASRFKTFFAPFAAAAANVQ